MLRRQAFASLQHGFLRSVENVFIYNFVTPNGVWENVLLYNIDTCFLITLIGRCYAFLYSWQIFLPGRCYLPYEMWQMLLPLRKMLSPYFVSGRSYCHMMLWKMLYHFTVCCNTLYWLMLLSDGRWNSQPHIIVIYHYYDGRCYCPVADGMATAGW